MFDPNVNPNAKSDPILSLSEPAIIVPGQTGRILAAARRFARPDNTLDPREVANALGIDTRNVTSTRFYVRARYGPQIWPWATRPREEGDYKPAPHVGPAEARDRAAMIRGEHMSDMRMSESADRRDDTRSGVCRAANGAGEGPRGGWAETPTLRETVRRYVQEWKRGMNPIARARAGAVNERV